MPRYPSDLTDAEWSVLEPEARAVMAGLVRAQGRPMVHDLRAMVDAIAYVVRYGIEWRAGPRDFPPPPAGYGFFQRRARGGPPPPPVGQRRAPGRPPFGGAEMSPPRAIA